MSKKKIHIGILGSAGYGTSARQYLNNSACFEIVACMDIDKRAATKAATAERAQAYTDMPEFLAHDGMEAVAINTPIQLHARHAIAALNAGLHVFMTKPVTNKSRDARAILDTAETKALACMISHHARHVHSARFISKMVQGGRLGKVCNGIVVCCSSGGLEQQEGDWRTLPGENPGGPLLQCGIHSIDFLLSLFGPVKRVMSMMQESITAHRVVDNTMTLLEFSCGVQFTLISNYTTAYMHSTDIFGTKANLHIHKHITGLGQEEMYLQQRAAGPHEPWQALRIPAGGSYPDDHGGVLEKEFARQIRQVEYDYTNLNESIHALVILEAAVESHATGKAVIL